MVKKKEKEICKFISCSTAIVGRECCAKATVLIATVKQKCINEISTEPYLRHSSFSSLLSHKGQGEYTQIKPSTQTLLPLIMIHICMPHFDLSLSSFSKIKNPHLLCFLSSLPCKDFCCCCCC